MKNRVFTLLGKYLLTSPKTNRTRARSPGVFMCAPTGDGDLSPTTTDLSNLNSTMREIGEREEREENEEREGDPKITLGMTPIS